MSNRFVGRLILQQRVLPTYHVLLPCGKSGESGYNVNENCLKVI